MSDTVTIEIHRNCYKIYPFKLSRWDSKTRSMVGTSPTLDKYYRVFEKYPKYITFTDKLKLYDKNEHVFYVPIGADIETIKDKLSTDGTYFNIIDKSNEYVCPRDISFSIDEKYQLRDMDQAEGITFLTTDKLFHTRILALSTGKGKTFCSVISAFKLGMPILIISETISDQWIKNIEEYTGGSCTIANKRIKLVKGSSNFINMLNNRKADKSYFYITTASTLYSAIEKYGKEMINKVCEFLGIGIKCFDEYHLHWAQNTIIDMSIKAYLTWYVTATPSRSQQSEKSLFYKITKKIPVYGTKTFYERVDINIINVEYNTFPNEYEHQQCFGSKGLSGILYWNYLFSKYSNIVYICGILRIIIDEMIQKEPNGKILIYLCKIEHINKLKEEFENIYTRMDFGNYTTAVEKKKKRMELNNNVIFTTVQSGGVGLDVENLQCVISMVPFSSNITAVQLIGRLRELKDENGKPKELYLYDCYDIGFGAMIRQHQTRMSVYQHRAKTSDTIQISQRDAIEYLRNNV